MRGTTFTFEEPLACIAHMRTIQSESGEGRPLLISVPFVRRQVMVRENLEALRLLFTFQPHNHEVETIVTAHILYDTDYSVGYPWKRDEYTAEHDRDRARYGKADNK
jgi:hypothetical protein